MVFHASDILYICYPIEWPRVAAPTQIIKKELIIIAYIFGRIRAQSIVLESLEGARKTWLLDVHGQRMAKEICAVRHGNKSERISTGRLASASSSSSDARNKGWAGVQTKSIFCQQLWVSAAMYPLRDNLLPYTGTYTYIWCISLCRSNL